MAVAMAIITLSLIIFAAVGYWLSELVIHIRTYDDEDIYTHETKAGTLVRADVDSLPQEKVFIPSPFGYQLHGLFFVAPEECKKAVILVHGITASHVSSLKYMEIFRKRGFYVLAYDHCRHGGSGGASTTFGLYEKHDLDACVEWLIKRLGPHCKIGIFGESMGAATALQHAAIYKRVAFYIADCPYSDLITVLKHRLKTSYRLPLPSFPVIQIAGLFAWLRAGLRFNLVSPIREMTKVETPVLFIHGIEDKYIPMEMTLDLYNAKPGHKHLYLAEGADHAQSLRMNPHTYDCAIEAFLAELGLGQIEQTHLQLE